MTDFSEILAGIPDYKEYMSVDELNASSEVLAKEYPDTVKILELGSSASGETIPCLKIGEGKHRGLIYGFPNPEEPLGGLLIDYFSRALAEDNEILKELDFTWYLIKCIDPDGARPNEGFLKGPHTPLNFSENYYRTPRHLTGETNFPYRVGDLDFNNPRPETRALMKLLGVTGVDFISSLHNMKWGGITYEVPEPCPWLYPKLHRVAKDHNIFLRKRLGSMATPGVQVAGYFTPVLNYIRAKAAGRGTVEEIDGAFVYEYVKLINPDVFMMIPECCLWYDDRCWNDRPTDVTVEEVMEYSSRISSKTNKFMISLFDRAQPLCRSRSPFLQMMKSRLENARRPTVYVSDPEPEHGKSALMRHATVAEKTAIEGRADIYSMFYIGGIIRMIDFQLAQSGAEKGKLKAYKEEAVDKLSELNNYVNNRYEVRTWPIKNLLGMNLGSILHSVEYVKLKKMWMF